MKKVVAFSLIAVAALGLGACTPKAEDNSAAANEVEISNDVAPDLNEVASNDVAAEAPANDVAANAN
jgi:hypothetical protein